MKYFNVIATAIILVLAFALLKDCGREPMVTTETHTETVYETVYDSVDRIVYVDRPVPVQVLPPETVYVLDDEQCEQLAAAFYSKYIYDNVLQDDSLAFISLRDTVFMNQLMGRTLTYRDRTPTELITTTTTTTHTTMMADRPRYRIYVGPFVSYSSCNTPGLGGGVLLSSKTFAAGYAYDFTTQSNYLQMYFSIIRGSKGN